MVNSLVKIWRIAYNEESGEGVAMTMTEKLDQLMEERGLNKASLSREASIPYMTIVNFYEKGTENVKRSTLLKLSRYFGVTVDYLAVDEEMRRTYPASRPVAAELAGPADVTARPRIAELVRGSNVLDPVNVEGYTTVPANVRCDFTMRFHGDSMSKIGVCDGDTVYVRAQNDVKNHEIAAVILEGRLTLRRVYKNDNQIVFMAENAAYAPLVVRAENSFPIVGKAVAFLGEGEAGNVP